MKNGTFFMNGEVPTVPTGKLYFTLGLQTRDASSGAFARSGVTENPEDSHSPTRNLLAMSPNGFVPFINGDIADRSAIVGHKMQWNDWNVDLSHTYGVNDLKYNVTNTLNASIANRDLLNGGRGITPTSSDARGFSFRQATTNLDISRFFPQFSSRTNVALGAEYRSKRYKILAGEAGSYIDAGGPGFGGNAGSQGCPGFQPVDATNKPRNSVAG